MLAFLGLRLMQHCQFFSLECFVKKEFFFWKELRKQRRLRSMPNHKLFKNVYLEKMYISICDAYVGGVNNNFDFCSSFCLSEEMPTYEINKTFGSAVSRSEFSSSYTDHLLRHRQLCILPTHDT
jgi:hypothetical protein